MKKMGLHELISLTFDSDPKVRKQAAVELSKYDAPGVAFALVELTYDKDSGVQEVARGLLEEMKKKNREPELMSFADVFSKGESGGAIEEEPAAQVKSKEDTTREKMLRPIEKMFEKKLGKEKAEEMKKRMMPTIEKMYEKAADASKGEKKSGSERGKTVQDMLEEYLDVIAHAQDKGDAKEVEQKSLAEELGLVGSREIEAGKVLAEAEEGAIADEAADDGEPSAEEEWSRGAAAGASQAEPTMFKLAFDSMMASKGDQKVMKETMKKLLKSTEEQIRLAFKVAKKRYSEINITNITELKNGMRNITTGPLYAKSVEHKDYQRTKTKKDTMTRIVVADQGGNEGVIYLFEERGMHIKPGMKLKVERGYAKTFDWSGETAMTVSKKGNVFIVV
ncbi:hypothetical protein JW721_01465 [Candidatus Micrarchaeota archaeon]|nr:hypothetical protein [Candidatus Micrarchaeota archaeon]